MLSAFGVEHERLSKSQLPNGQYKPANKLTAQERSGVRGAGKTRSGPKTAEPASAANRNLHDVYRGWGVEPAVDQIKSAKTRPSKVHSNIHYADSVSSELEGHLDRSLSSDQVKRLKHPVVFHHGATAEGAMAAATGAHKTVGNKGHVVINHNAITSDAKITVPTHVGFKHTVNHELAHAAISGRNPRNFMKDGEINAVRSMGEEARADAMSIPNRGLYRRQGVPGPVGARVSHQIGRTVHRATGFDTLEEGGKAAVRYNQVHRQVRRAVGNRPGAVKDAIKLAAQGPLKHPTATVIAGAAGVAAYDRHKQKLRKSAFGVPHEILKASPVAGEFKEMKNASKAYNRLKSKGYMGSRWSITGGDSNYGGFEMQHRRKGNVILKPKSTRVQGMFSTNSDSGVMHIQSEGGGFTRSAKVGAGVAGTAGTADAGVAGYKKIKKSAFGIDHGVSKSVKTKALATGAKVANKAGYPTKVRDFSVRADKGGQYAEFHEHIGRKGSWAVTPSGTTRNFTTPTTGQGTTVTEVRRQPMKLTRAGKVAGGTAGGTGYVGGIVGTRIHQKHQRQKAAAARRARRAAATGIG